jgi:hypothetical protein
VNINKKKCESCQLKRPNFGLPAEGKARWCSGCAKEHAGAVDISHKKCEGCGLKQPHFGLTDPRIYRGFYGTGAKSLGKPIVVR